MNIELPTAFLKQNVQWMKSFKHILADPIQFLGAISFVLGVLNLQDSLLLQTISMTFIEKKSGGTGSESCANWFCMYDSPKKIGVT